MSAGNFNSRITIFTCWHASLCTWESAVTIYFQHFSKPASQLSNEEWLNPNYNIDRMSIDNKDFSNR